MYKAITAISLTFLLSLALIGCNKTDDSVNGTYVHDIRTPGDGIGAITLILSGTENAEFKVRPPGEKVLQSSEGTYAVDGNAITVVINGGATVYTLRGSKLFGEFLDQSIVLLKK